MIERDTNFRLTFVFGQNKSMLKKNTSLLFLHSEYKKIHSSGCHKVVLLSEPVYVVIIEYFRPRTSHTLLHQHDFFFFINTSTTESSKEKRLNNTGPSRKI